MNVVKEGSQPIWETEKVRQTDGENPSGDGRIGQPVQVSIDFDQKAEFFP